MFHTTEQTDSIRLSTTWWEYYGDEHLKLQKFATRVLS